MEQFTWESAVYIYVYKRIAEEWLHMYSRDREVYAALLPLMNINIYTAHGCNACLTNERVGSCHMQAGKRLREACSTGGRE